MAGLIKRFIGALLATVCANAVAASPDVSAQTITNRWVINTGGTPAAGVLQALQARLGVPVKLIRPMLQPGSVLVELPKLPTVGTLQSVLGITDTMRGLPGVVFASPDVLFVRTAVPAPNDDNYASNQANYMEQSAYASLNMLNVWQRTRGSAATVIAVLDSGVLYDHPDLKGRLLPGYDFVSQPTPSTGTRESGSLSQSGSNDGDGRDSDPSDPGDAPPAGATCGDGSQTSSFHGTAVASVAVAQANNGRFMAGMDWNAKVLPARVSGRCGIATSADIIDAMYWATGSGRVDPALGLNPNPAQIINLSFASDIPLGATCSGATSDAVRVAIADARAANVAVVISAGNNGGGAVQFPASCPGAIAAVAAQSDGLLASYTAQGRASGSSLVIAAPGDAFARYLGANNGGVPSGTKRGAPDPTRHNTLLFQGTSFSAPMVAGTISLLRAVKPGLSADDALVALRNTVKPFPTNAGLCTSLLFGTSRCNCTATSCANGILNPLAAVNAVQASSPGVPLSNAPQSRTVNQDGGFGLDGSLSSNAAGQTTGLTYRWRQVFGNPVLLASTTGSTLQVQSGMAGNVAEFELQVTDVSSNLSNTSVVRVVNSSVDERLFRPSMVVAPPSAGGSTGSSGTPTSTSESGTTGVVPSGGGGGALNAIGLLAMALLIALHRRGLHKRISG